MTVLTLPCSLRLSESENSKLPIADAIENSIDCIERALGAALQAAVARKEWSWWLRGRLFLAYPLYAKRKQQRGSR